MNERGMTELHLAAYHGELDWVQNCLRGGLDVHATDQGGYTPLHWAADMGVVDGDREEIVAALIEAGADVNARCFSGRSILTVAKAAGNEEIVRQLIKSGAYE
jgi:ankyrin repeat protein